MILTEKEIETIESYRPGVKPTKIECITLQGYKNKLLIAAGLSKDKRNCFCAQSTRTQWKNEFYIYYDNYNAPTIIPKENA